MVVIEIPMNPNCEAVETRVFHDLESPRPVRQVRLERTPGQPAWYAVVGWTTSGTTCQALAQKVDDSGDGVALLLHGGDAGLRLQPAGQETQWELGHPEQWGEPFIITADSADVQ